MSLLTICQEAASALGLRQPAVIAGSSDLTAQILFRLANEAGKHLMRYHDWQNLIVQATVTTTATVIQSGALPTASFDRLIYNAELWNVSLNQRYMGPTPQRYWRELRGSALTSSSPGWWRIIGNNLEIYPAPTADQLLVFEYIDKRFCQSSGGTAQSAFMADSDTARIDEELFTLEMVWRFRKSRGFAQYAEDMETAEREKEKVAARDRGTGRIRPESTDADFPPGPLFLGHIDG